MYQIQFQRSPRTPIAGLRGPTSKGRGREGEGEGGKDGKGMGGGKGKGRDGKGREGTGRGGDETPPLHAPLLIHISGYAPGIWNIVTLFGHRTKKILH